MPRKFANRGSERGHITWKRPLSINPWSKRTGSDENGSVWIHMKPSKIIDQRSKGAGTITTQELNTEFIFLAPLNLNENIVHHWEAYESVASRLAQKVRSAVKLGAELSAMTNVFGNTADLASAVKDTFKKGLTEGQSVEEYINKAYRVAPSSRIPPIKVDTPLYYTNSDRRQIVLEFQLFNEHIPNLENKPEDVLITPIKELMKFSSPDFKGDINIQFPYMWDIKTQPKDFIHYSTCALIGVQPTWNSPYIKGYPASVNLQLTFQDLSPLYAGTIDEGSIINVIHGSKSRSRLSIGQTPVISATKGGQLKKPI